MISLENFLTAQAEKTEGIHIVGGSSLFTEELPEAISINGFHKECSVAAINSNRSDFKRCNGKFQSLLAPFPKKKLHESIIVPERKFEVPEGFPGREPTTYFSLILTCDRLGLYTYVYGICGLASKWHYGDWEMWYMKHKTERVKVYDPRPAW
jgi:hypothetical protein